MNPSLVPPLAPPPAATALVLSPDLDGAVEAHGEEEERVVFFVSDDVQVDHLARGGPVVERGGQLHAADLRGAVPGEEEVGFRGRGSK